MVLADPAVGFGQRHDTRRGDHRHSGKVETGEAFAERQVAFGTGTRKPVRHSLVHLLGSSSTPRTRLASQRSRLNFWACSLQVRLIVGRHRSASMIGRRAALAAATDEAPVMLPPAVRRRSQSSA